MSWERLLLAVLLSLSLAGCPTEEDDDDSHVCGDLTRAMTYVEGLEADSTSQGVVLSLVSATPAPPDVGSNDWIFEVTDSTGTPLIGCTAEVVPFMPDHGHGTTGTPVWSETNPADGTYTSSWEAIMPGYWEVTVSVDCGDGVEDHLLGFCAEG